MVQQISNSELELMKIIWARGGNALYADIMEELVKTGRIWQKNTIITLLSRLAEKGFLKVGKIGHRNEYTAVISEEDYQTTQTQMLLNKLYEGSAKGLVSALIQREMLSAEDYEELRQFWAKEKKGKNE
ncbi:MAG: BlaI/MecI/CopY family transcriptional regulator [Lachnospiraceae bacterium]|jgi:predicted transcriptional regulator|nr:BlaI/MecI/CopY family transcriptional regulator [Lachnospiraceae bacterium]